GPAFICVISGAGSFSVGPRTIAQRFRFDPGSSLPRLSAVGHCYPLNLPSPCVYSRRPTSVNEESPQPITHLTPDPTAQQSRWQRWFTLDFTPLRDSREFRLLYLGQSITFFGSMMTFVALPWQVFQLTKSSFAVGMLGVVEFIAVLIMGFVGGALADYLDRRLMVRITEAALATGSIVLIINARLAHPRLWILFACAAVFAALTALQRPSLEALIPRIVKPEQMPAVAALQAFRGSIAMIGGPAVGGLLVVTFGPALAFSVDLSTFVVSLIALTLMKAVPPPLEADRPG